MSSATNKTERQIHLVERKHPPPEGHCGLFTSYLRRSTVEWAEKTREVERTCFGATAPDLVIVECTEKGLHIIG